MNHNQRYIGVNLNGTFFNPNSYTHNGYTTRSLFLDKAISRFRALGYSFISPEGYSTYIGKMIKPYQWVSIWENR